MTTVVIKQHDTKMTFRDTPTINGVPVSSADLVGATVSFLLKCNGIAVKQAAIINPDATFSYIPVATDVANTGEFQQEWEVIYVGGKILTFPNGGWNVVKIIPDLG